MKRSLCAAGALLIAVAALTAAQPQKGKKPETPSAKGVAARPKQHNQFVTVDEFARSRRAPRIAVSVEGYVVLGYRAPDGGLRLCLTDSVDHVLNTRDADSSAVGGAVGIVTPAALKKHPRWAWTARGIQRFVMYTGAGRAQRPMHDVVAKMRLTGWTAPGRARINPVTKIEFQDENGEWKAL